MKRIVTRINPMTGCPGRALECSGLDGTDEHTVYDWRPHAVRAFELGINHPAELFARERPSGPPSPQPPTGDAVASLEAQLRVLALQIRGLELEQGEIAQMFQEGRDGTRARKLLEHFAALARVSDATLSPADAMELAAKQSPELYAAYTQQITATRGGAARPPTSAAAAAEVLALARSEQAADASLSLAAAMERVFRQKPDLYARYAAEAAVKV